MSFRQVISVGSATTLGLYFFMVVRGLHQPIWVGGRRPPSAHFLFSDWRAPDVSVRFVRRSDSGVTAGFEGPECNLGNRERFKVSRGNKRRGSAERNFGSRPARSALVAWRTCPAMMGIRMTRCGVKFRSSCTTPSPQRKADDVGESRRRRLTFERPGTARETPTCRPRRQGAGTYRRMSSFALSGGGSLVGELEK